MSELKNSSDWQLVRKNMPEGLPRILVNGVERLPEMRLVKHWRPRFAWLPKRLTKLLKLYVVEEVEEPVIVLTPEEMRTGNHVSILYQTTLG